MWIQKNKFLLLRMWQVFYYRLLYRIYVTLVTNMLRYRKRNQLYDYNGYIAYMFQHVFTLILHIKYVDTQCRYHQRCYIKEKNVRILISSIFRILEISKLLFLKHWKKCCKNINIYLKARYKSAQRFHAKLVLVLILVSRKALRSIHEETKFSVNHCHQNGMSKKCIHITLIIMEVYTNVCMRAHVCAC